MAVVTRFGYKVMYKAPVWADAFNDRNKRALRTRIRDVRIFTVIVSATDKRAAGGENSFVPSRRLNQDRGKTVSYCNGLVV